MSAIDDLLDDGELFRDQKGRPRPWPRPLAPLADTHGHLTVFRGHDPARAVARAALAGVRLLVVPADPTEDATDARAFLRSLDGWVEGARSLLAAAAAEGLVPPAFPGAPDLCDNVRVVAGIHPYGAARADDAAMASLSELLAAPRCAGVGEIGLDFTCDVPVDVQRDVFCRQLRLARELAVPCELHIRDDRDDPAAAASFSHHLRAGKKRPRSCIAFVLISTVTPAATECETTSSTSASYHPCSSIDGSACAALPAILSKCPRMSNPPRSSMVSTCSKYFSVTYRRSPA